MQRGGGMISGRGGIGPGIGPGMGGGGGGGIGGSPFRGGGGQRLPWMDRGGPGPRPMTISGFPPSVRRGGPFGGRGAAGFRGRGRGGGGGGW